VLFMFSFACLAEMPTMFLHVGMLDVCFELVMKVGTVFR
jgi:hypothetical protein